MKRIVLLWGLLCIVVLSGYSQAWTPQDSLRLHKLLEGEGEIKINMNLLNELDKGDLLGTQQLSTDKSWMDFDVTMPALPKEVKKKVVLTLRPYTANTRYNWDPVYQKKMKVGRDTWRGDPFYGLTKHAHNMVAGGTSSGFDAMRIFSREFWNVKGNKRRARTLEVLKTYGDSTTVLIKSPVWLICD